MMPLITLIGERLAKKDKEFVFCGANMGCRDCKLRSVCLNLEEGRRYVIRNVRETRHECKLHEGSAVVVEIEKVPVKTSVHRRNAIEGAVVTVAELDCRNLACELYRTCHPPGMKEGMKGKLLKKVKDAECPAGLELAVVEVMFV